MANNQPDVTRTAEPPTPEQDVVVQPGHIDDTHISTEDVQQLSSSYAAVQATARAADRARIAKEFKALEKLTAKYETKLKAATQQAGGYDPKRFHADMQRILQLSDGVQVEQQIEHLKTQHGPAFTKMLDAVKVDRDSLQRELRTTITVPAHARERKRQTNGGLPAEQDVRELSWYLDPEDLPAPPPATSRAFQSMVPPYALSWRTGERTTVNTSNGNVNSYHKVDYGSSQNLAMVGSPFSVPSTVRRVRIDATVNAPYCYTVVGAAIGYASAEVILNLKVLDGTRLVSSSRLSVVRTIAVLFWVSSNNAGGRYWLSCEFDHSYGMARTYSAHVEVETWAGGFGAYGGAVASGNAYGEQFGITLS